MQKSCLLLLNFTPTIFLVGYLLLYHLHYYPTGIFEYQPYFWPRFYKNEFAEPFHDWVALCAVTSINIVIIFFLTKEYILKLCETKYIFILLLATSFVWLSFLYLTPNNLLHLKVQTDHEYNGLFFCIKNQFNKLPVFENLNFLNKLLFPFNGGYFNNNSGYTLIGTTHPPGQLSIGLIIYQFAEKMAKLTSFHIAIFWGATISILNSVSLILIYKILKFFSPAKVVREYMPIIISSTAVAVHFCVLSAGLSLLFLLSSILCICKIIHNVSRHKQPRYLICFLAGFFLTLQAQNSYVDGIPIFAITVAFLITLKKFNPDKTVSRNIIIFFLIPPFLYFVFEFIASSGSSNWIIRGLKLAFFVNEELTKLGRPWFVSQISNFSIIFWEAGLLSLATIYLLFYNTIIKVKCFQKNNQKIIFRFKDFMKFCGTAILIMCFAMVLQQANRLEVQRTWMWFLGPLWLYGFIVFRFYRNFFKSSCFLSRGLALKGLYLAQLAMTILYAVLFQDQQ